MFYIMVAINIIYVSAELVFNFILLNTASTQVKIEDIHSVEVLGRSLAAFGFTFIIWKIIQGLNYSNLNKILLIAIASTISYPLFYFGQEKLVNTFAENSSLETREKMNNIYLLKQGLINGSLQLNTVPYNEEIKDLPESKTFITNIPLFMINNDKVMNYTKDNKEKIANLVFKNEVLNNPIKYVNIYNEAVNEIHKKYLQFSSATQSKKTNITNIINLVDKQYADLDKYLNWRYRKENDIPEFLGMSFNEYVKTEQIQKVVKDKIKEKTGKVIDGTVDATSSMALKKSMIRNLEEKYEKLNSSYAEETGVNMPVGDLTKEEFLNHPEIQKALKKELGPLYVKMDFKEYSFTDNIVEEDVVLIKNNAEIIGSQIAKEFLNNNLDSEDSVSIVKAMIVPPIALFLSLIFAFINFFILIKSILDKNIKDNKKLTNGIVLGLVFMLLSFPMVLNNKYTESDSYLKVFKNMEDYNFVVAKSVHWVMKFEPFVYSYGEIFIKE